MSRDASSVFESGGVLDARHAAKIAGDSLTWRTGILNEISWTLTPARDGRSASLIARGPLGIDYTATFGRE